MKLQSVLTTAIIEMQLNSSPWLDENNMPFETLLLKNPNSMAPDILPLLNPI
jgi:hypothetical protein